MENGDVNMKVKCDYCGEEGEWLRSVPPSGKRIFCDRKCMEAYYEIHG